jgi:hypothetical protein
LAFGATGSGVSDFTIDRSATASTVVPAESELFPGAGSSVGESTEAVFDSVAAWAGAVTVMVIAGAVAFAASDARVQVTVPEACVQAQPVPAALTKETAPGRLSVTERLDAASGPALETESVYASLGARVDGIGRVRLHERQVGVQDERRHRGALGCWSCSRTRDRRSRVHARRVADSIRGPRAPSTWIVNAGSPRRGRGSIECR